MVWHNRERHLEHGRKHCTKIGLCQRAIAGTEMQDFYQKKAFFLVRTK